MPDINMSAFEEVRRNQLVTEVDIQTQVALDDYQVKLADIANPTQSQDNVVIDRFGEFLPHWNESLDFDTWVKMSMEIAGKRILMLRGNSNASSASSISNTFVGGDNFSIDKWTDSGSLVYVNTSNEWLYMKTDRSSTDHKSTKQVTPISDFEVEFSLHEISVSADTNLWTGGIGISSAAESIRTVDNFLGVFFQADASGTVGLRPYYIDGDSHIYDDSYSFGTGSGYDAIIILRRSGNSITVEIWNVDKSSLLKTKTWTSTSLGDLSYFMASNWNDGYGVQYTEWTADDMRMRKYTATEPTWAVDSEEQNITVAFKLLGRAG